MTNLADIPLPRGIRSRFVESINGLTMHVLEAGYEVAGRPCILLLHGFPELAYSWRKVMLPLAAAGFHVIAPDQRGYGRTTGWDGSYDGDLSSFRILNVVKDALALVFALGHRSVAAVIGHDFGSPVAAYCALTRPDVFRSVAMMSAPFAGPPMLPFAPGRPSLKPSFSTTSRRSTGHASTIIGTIRRAKPTTTCASPHRASTHSCARIIITRARTGNRTSPSSSSHGLPGNWRSCPPTT